MKTKLNEILTINKLDNAKSLKEIFDLVKEVIIETFSIKRPGLTIAMGNFDAQRKDVILGGFFSPNDNAIVVNKKILENIKFQNPKLFNSYLFHILLHEYLHSLGFVDEIETRKLAFLISYKHFGMNHDTTKIALNPSMYLRNFVEYKNNQENEIYDGFIKYNKSDRSMINYIG